GSSSAGPRSDRSCSSSFPPAGRTLWARRLVSFGSYQLLLITPVISPRNARLRKQMRHIWNLFRKARLRPQMGQRWYARTLNLGFSASRFAWAILDSLAISFPLGGPEGHAHVAQERATFLVVPGCGHDGDVHALDLPDLVVVDLADDDLLAAAHRVVALPVERLRGHALEVAHARQRDAHQAVEELVHAVLAQGDHAPDGLVLAQLEVGDALARAGHHGLLAGDRHHLLLGLLDQLVVVDRLAEAHVDDDLLHLRDLHGVLVPEVFHQLRDHVRLVGLGEARGMVALGMRLPLRGLDGRGGLLLLAALLRLLLPCRRRGRTFALGVLLVGLLFLRLLVVCHRRSLLVDLRAAPLGEAHPLAVLQELGADSGRLLRFGVDEGEVGEVDGAV